MSNATRYLCAAAYLSTTYANRVIAELLSSRRAVAPSIGVDLGPIIRHCLRARKLQLTRDILLSVLLLLGLIFGSVLMFIILILAFFFGFLPKVKWAEKSLTVKIVSVVASVFLFANLLFLVFAFLAVAFLAALASSLTGGGAGLPSSFLVVSVVPGLLIMIALVVVEVVYTYNRNRTLRHELAPGAVLRNFPPQDPRTETRIAQVEAAQNGNLILYGAQDPFIGAGIIMRSWSIAVELQRSKTANSPFKGGSGPKRGKQRNPERDYVPIDPVQLHEVIRDRLLAMRDEELPPWERLTSLTVHDHLVAPGVQSKDSPLIDPGLGIPYSEVSVSAADAFIRHPQAGVRYYQRASVRDEGQEVWAGPEKVMNGLDQEISSSAFVHVAVEGRMFYLEFVAACMPPLHPVLHLADQLPRFTSGGFLGRAIVNGISAIFSDLIRAPVRAYRTLRALRREARAYQVQTADHVLWPFYDLGAEFSVRESWAEDHPRSYIQVLDAEKYTKLTERLVIDTVADHLTDQGVDVSAFMGSAANVFHDSVLITDSTINGSVVNKMTNAPQPGQQSQPDGT